jgi:hypothetical protein
MLTECEDVDQRVVFFVKAVSHKIAQVSRLVHILCLKFDNANQKDMQHFLQTDITQS